MQSTPSYFLGVLFPSSNVLLQTPNCPLKLPRTHLIPAYPFPTLPTPETVQSPPPACNSDHSFQVPHYLNDLMWTFYSLLGSTEDVCASSTKYSLSSGKVSLVFLGKPLSLSIQVTELGMTSLTFQG